MSEENYRLDTLCEISDRFVVLSGCSGGGKSSLLAELGRRGFSVFEEAGRQIVKEQLFIGGSALPWSDPVGFVELVVSRSLHQMASAARDRHRNFFDRGVIDAVSFLEHHGLAVPRYLETAVSRLRYCRTVFATPPWPEIFAQDAERRHGFVEAKATYATLLGSYRRLGYTVVELPICDVGSRADFVLGTLGEL